MSEDYQKFTREHLGVVIRRLRDNPQELIRVKGALKDNHARTLVRDVKGNGTNRKPDRKIDPVYIEAVCRVAFSRFGSDIYNSIITAAVPDFRSQELLDNMIGNYHGYWPASESGRFTKFALKIGKDDGAYWVETTTRDQEHEFQHFGYAFLIRKRVHVIAVREYGIRTMIIHYEEVPARHPPRGIICNILQSKDNAKPGEILYAEHFLAIHEKDRRYSSGIKDIEIQQSLYSDRNRDGVIRVE